MHYNHTPEEIAKRIAELPEPTRRAIAIGEKYYWISGLNLINHNIWNGDNTDCDFQKVGNIFETEKDAQAHADFRKWLYGEPKLTLAQCWEQADENDSMAPPAAKAEEFLRLARKNSLI